MHLFVFFRPKDPPASVVQNAEGPLGLLQKWCPYSILRVWLNKVALKFKTPLFVIYLMYTISDLSNHGEKEAFHMGDKSPKNKEKKKKKADKKATSSSSISQLVTPSK